jgi:putative CocE/NonD family hydrolase
MKLLHFFLVLPIFLFSQEIDLRQDYIKYECKIPMRDGAKLHTVVYVPKDSTQKFPIILGRTPYTTAPYGSDYLKANGNNYWMAQEKYILVFQDVRGKFLSEGEYEDVRPINIKKKTNTDVDESTDAYDTIEWLIKNVKRNNGKVGMIGISYPGFYAAAALVNAHPALKAVSPQAPIGDWFLGDDFHHNGAVFLVDAFNFYHSFGKPRPVLTTQWPNAGFEYNTPDAYQFLLKAGSIASLKKKYYGDTVKFWNEVFDHPNYDEFWRTRNLPQHLNNIRPAVLTVGGWFDAEDLYGTLHTYDAIEKNNPSAKNSIIIGPWFHGGWVRSNGSKLGNVSFGVKSSEYYDLIIRKFFNYYLKGIGDVSMPEVSAFETGSNVWKTYDSWPPKNAEKKKIYLRNSEQLSFSEPIDSIGFDEYISDPKRPVPYTNDITNGRDREYMTGDQRFVWQRPDVLSYEMNITEDMTIAGPMTANLFVSTTGSDADFIVKVIDVFPQSTKNDSTNPSNIKMGGYQMMVRGEVMRARYRNSFGNPEALKPGVVEQVSFALQDINHTFKKGHSLMIQIQSSWFPLVDRNPQKFINIYSAKDEDFVKATQTIYHSCSNSSNLEVTVLKK